MNQEKVSKFIKEIRKKNKLSQTEFGEKYGVTYQSVSKWENAKNLPDISILKEICNDYHQDINELLENTNFKRKKKNPIIYIIIVLLLITLMFLIQLYIHTNKEEFQFKTIKTTCNDFELFGSIAYDKTKTSIYISNITYCGTDSITKYKEFECTLYESTKNTKTKIQKIHYQEKSLTIEEFLKQVKFNVDYNSSTCKKYKKNSMFLELKAITENNKTILYNIPLELEDNC